MRADRELRPSAAWAEEAGGVYPVEDSAARVKGCPKSTFVGLWTDLFGASDGGDSGPNAGYALATFRLLQQHPEWSNPTPPALWDRLRETRREVP